MLFAHCTCPWTQVQDVCVCQGVVTRVEGMRRMHVHKVCLRQVYQETVGMEDDGALGLKHGSQRFTLGS